MLAIGSEGITRVLSPLPLVGGKGFYEADRIRDLRIIPPPSIGFRPFRSIDSVGFAFGKLKGRVAVKYDGRKLELGNGLTDEEARQVLEVLQQGLESGAAAEDLSKILEPEVAPKAFPARRSFRLAAFAVPWTIGTGIALIAMVAPFQGPLLIFVSRIHIANQSLIVTAILILLGRALAGGFVGPGIGYFQGQALSTLVADGRGWIIACCASYAIGDIANVLLLGRIRDGLGVLYSLVDPLVEGAPAQSLVPPLAVLLSFQAIAVSYGVPYGAIIAIPQWIYLRTKISGARRWLAIYPAAFASALGLASAVAWFGGLVLFGAMQFGDAEVLQIMQVVGLLGWPIPAAILSGAGMVAAVRLGDPK